MIYTNHLIVCEPNKDYWNILVPPEIADYSILYLEKSNPQKLIKRMHKIVISVLLLSMKYWI